MSQLPSTETLSLEVEGHALHITLNRPKARNAMSLQMVHELMQTFESVQDNLDIRVIVLRGSDGHFCAGGDIKDMASARATASKRAAEDEDPFYALNREFGRMLTYANQVPQVLIVVTEGAVLGGGFGLACISDLALSLNDAQFGLPETGLGIPPAQIAPFVVTRVGLTQARRLALFGARFTGEQAKSLGIVHESYGSVEALEAALAEAITQVKRCAPEANRITKDLILNVGTQELDTLLEGAAHSFASAVQGKEGQEGTMAFIQKRKASWAE
jgi:isohexenylglutaconyl-CoA hydratase